MTTPTAEIALQLNRSEGSVRERARGYLGLHREKSTRPLSDYPHLMAEWHPNLNTGLDPNLLTSGSSRRVWWQCSRDPAHIWEAVIANRTRGATCRFCARWAADSSTSLAACYPELAAEWHPSANGAMTASQVLPGSNRRVVWKCQVNPAHEWTATPNDRVGKSSGCPHCSQAQESRIEIVLRFELGRLLGDSGSDRNLLIQGRRFAVDYLSPRNRLIVEYDGAYWHIGREINDEAKNAALRESGWRVTRIREHPLEKLSSEDLVVPAMTSEKQLVVLVAEHLRDHMGISVPGLGEYAATAELQCSREILDYLSASRKRTVSFCRQCGAEYIVKASRSATSHYCSTECYWKHGRVEIKCEWCGCSFETIGARATKRRYCSRSCQASAYNARRWGDAPRQA